MEKYHVAVRKLCHLAGYAILGLLASIAIYYLFAPPPSAAKFWQAYALGVVLTVAALDEIRQSFYPSRTGSIKDVALDGAGGLLGIILFWIFV